MPRVRRRYRRSSGKSRALRCLSFWKGYSGRWQPVRRLRRRHLRQRWSNGLQPLPFWNIFWGYSGVGYFCPTHSMVTNLVCSLCNQIDSTPYSALQDRAQRAGKESMPTRRTLGASTVQRESTVFLLAGARNRNAAPAWPDGTA